MAEMLDKAKALAKDAVDKVTHAVSGSENKEAAQTESKSNTAAAPSGLKINKEHSNPDHSIGPLSPAEEAKLDDLIAHRPSAKELQDKNILKDTKVAPALQQNQEALRKKQIEDALTEKIAHRPEPKDLQAQGILKESKVAPSLQAAQDQLKTAQLKDGLDAKLAHRPSPDQLAEKNILQTGDGGQVHTLHTNVGHALEEKLEHRPAPEELIDEGILNKDENPKAQ